MSETARVWLIGDVPLFVLEHKFPQKNFTKLKQLENTIKKF